MIKLDDRQQKKRIRNIFMYLWIFFLTLISGYINVVGLLRFDLPITYVSGKIVQMASHIVTGTWDLFRIFFTLVFCFFIGSFLSGILFSKQKFVLRIRYGLILLFYSIVIWTMSIYFSESRLMAYSLAFIVGSQNGFFLYHRGAIVRTTHMTGYLSDAGVILGRAIRGNVATIWKAYFYLLNILSFFIGGLFGAYMIIYHYEWSYLLIAINYFFAAVLFFILRRMYAGEKIHFTK